MNKRSNAVAAAKEGEAKTGDEEKDDDGEKDDVKNHIVIHEGECETNSGEQQLVRGLLGD